MATKLAISQEEYIKLRKSGLTPDQIVEKHKAKSQGEQVSNMADKVTDFFGGRAVADTFGTEIARAATKDPIARANIEASAPSVKKTVGSALQLGSTFLPGAGAGASLAKKVAVGAATGYMTDVGADLQADKSLTEAVTPGLGTAIGITLPIASSIVGWTVKEGSHALAKKLEDLNLRMTPVEKQNLQKKGTDIAEYLSKQQVVGTPGQRLAKVSTLYDDMETKVDSLIKGKKVTFQKEDVIKALQDIPEQFDNDPELQNEAVSTIKRVIQAITDRQGETLTPEYLQALKRNYFKRAFGANTTDIVSDSRLAIGGLFKGLLDDSIPELKGLNQEYAYIIAARRALQKAATRNEVGIIGQAATTAATSAIGGALAGPAGVAAGAILGPKAAKIVAGTAVRSATGASAEQISKLAQAVSKILPDGKGNIPLKSVLALLNTFLQEQQQSTER